MYIYLYVCVYTMQYMLLRKTLPNRLSAKAPFGGMRSRESKTLKFTVSGSRRGHLRCQAESHVASSYEWMRTFICA